MKHIYLLTFLLITSLAFTQSDFNTEDFTASRADIATNVFEKDSTANALVIYDYGNSYIDKNSFKLTTEIKRKIKILNRKGFVNATVEIYLYIDSNNRKETVKDIFATTYNLENGEVTKTELKKSDIYEEERSEKIKIIKFTLPNIQEGSVLTYSYVKESPFIYKYYPWEFQSDIPKLYSEYNTSIPGNYEYNIKLVGNQKLDVNDSQLAKNCLSAFNGSYADCSVSKYVMKDVPAFVEEDFMTTKDNYLSRIEYELKVFKGFDGRVDNITKSWKDADTELKGYKSIGKQIGKSTSLDGLVASVITNKNDKLTTAKEIYKFVQDNYTWNGDYKIFNDDASIKNIIKSNSGNVAEMNLLLHNLLEEHGIDVKPVLLSTRENGFPTRLFPVISEFNYIIVQTTIDGETYLLDATDDYLSFGELPFRCLNQDGRLLDFKNGSEWITIEANKTSAIQYQVDLKLSDDLVKGDVTAKHIGYDALPKKKKFFKNEKAYTEDIADMQTDITINDHQVETLAKNAEEFVETYQIELHDSNHSDDMIYMNPFIYKFFKNNPFKLQERTYPIDFGYKKSYVYSVQIDYGDAYEVIETPKDINGKLPNDTGDIILKSTVNEGKLILFFKLSFKESLYNPGYYSTLKAYIDKVLDVQSNSLVVLKKT